MIPILKQLTQPGLHIELEANLGYIERPCFKKKKKLGILTHTYNPNSPGG